MDVEFLIPKLRQDLKVYEGSVEKDGSPTWMLYDPLSDNYFKIGWFEFECLLRMESVKNMGKLAEKISAETSLDPDKDDVYEFIVFLISNNLFQSSDPIVQNFIKNREDEKKSSFFRGVFSKYLYTHIPLFAPDKFLKVIYPYTSFLFTKRFVFSLMALLIFGLVLTVQRIDEFTLSFTSFVSVEGIILTILSTIIVKTVHEFGHALVSHRYGIPVTTMGVAFIVLYPILYTETTNSWRLFDRKKRAHIAIAGVYFELILATIALILWHVLPAGFAQNITFFVAVISLAASLFINGNPLMKFDGYYLLSDVMGIDNLQIRAISYLKWKLRDLLFNVDGDPPEVLDINTEKFLVGFGLALSIYRFFLYLGIAMLIYHVFFKPLGAVLMFVEIYWFILFPVLRELLSWYNDRVELFKQKRPKIISFMLFFAVFLMFLPFGNTVSIPAVVHAKQYSSFYPITVSKLVSVNVNNGDRVSKNDALFVLESLDLEAQISVAEYEVELYTQLSERSQLGEDGKDSEVVYEEKIIESKTKLEGLLLQKDRLIIRASHDGVVCDVGADIKKGRWVNLEVLLGRVVGRGGVTVSGYVSDRNVNRLLPGEKGMFRYAHSLFEQIPVSLIDNDLYGVRTISYPELASIYGGIIPANLDGNKGVIAKHGLYKIEFNVEGYENFNVPYTRHGVVRLRVQKIIPIVEFSKKILSLFYKEASI